MDESQNQDIASVNGKKKDMQKYEQLSLLVVGMLILILSGLHPYDRATWVLEVLPIFIGVPILVALYPRFQFTPLAYRLVFLHAVILMAGGHYTYARVPLGFWVQDLLELGRNHYDRLGHLAQGFIPAILAREILLRRSPLKPGKWLFFLVTCVCLAISACYEFVEWWTALIGGEKADDFLGTQGDVWDTQWDMFCAFIGAMLSQIFFSRLHDRELAQLTERHRQMGIKRRPYDDDL
jgi:putative membrane protein